MATAARQRSVRSREREGRLGVVERCAQPIHRAVAHRAVRREPGGNVVRIRGLLESREVASRTLQRRSGKLAADVALRALHGGVRSRERKLGCAVIESRGQP